MSDEGKFLEFFPLITVFFLFFAAPDVPALPRIQTFDNRLHCKATKSCSLLRFEIQSEDKEVILSEYREVHWVSKMRAFYQTDTVDHLEDYAIVQFVRGCRFDSRIEDGKLIKRLSHGMIQSFGKYVDYFFPDWTIDSVDSDPIYHSDDRVKDRHYLYRWNTVPGSFENSSQKFYGVEKPVRPILYVKDLISSAFVNQRDLFYKTASNNSIQFRTCIYRTAEIPKQVANPTDVNFAKPIYCFEWASSLVYNHSKQKFESPAVLDAFCSAKKER